MSYDLKIDQALEITCPQCKRERDEPCEQPNGEPPKPIVHAARRSARTLRDRPIFCGPVCRSELARRQDAGEIWPVSAWTRYKRARVCLICATRLPSWAFQRVGGGDDDEGN